MELFAIDKKKSCVNSSTPQKDKDAWDFPIFPLHFPLVFPNGGRSKEARGALGHGPRE